MTDEIKLIWEDGPRPEGLDEIVRADIQSLWGLGHPSDLMTHHVKLTDDWDGPGVHVYGREGSDSFYCAYHETTKWVSLKDTDETIKNREVNENDAKGNPPTTD